MTISAYKYVSDAGATFQVSLPDDFAIALSEVPATGIEPYLDASISPRYAVYRTISGITRSAIITTQTLFGSLSTSLIVDGVTYFLNGAFGESIPPLAAPLLFSPQGPQGPPGQSFVSSVFQATSTDDGGWNFPNGQTILSLSVPAGMFFVTFKCTSYAQTTNLSAWTFEIDSTVNPGYKDALLGNYDAQGIYYTIVLTAYVDNSAGAGAINAVLTATGAQPRERYLRMIALKIG